MEASVYAVDKKGGIHFVGEEIAEKYKAKGFELFTSQEKAMKRRMEIFEGKVEVEKPKKESKKDAE